MQGMQQQQQQQQQQRRQLWLCHGIPAFESSKEQAIEPQLLNTKEPYGASKSKTAVALDTRPSILLARCTFERTQLLDAYVRAHLQGRIRMRTDNAPQDFEHESN